MHQHQTPSDQQAKHLKGVTSRINNLGRQYQLNPPKESKEFADVDLPQKFAAVFEGDEGQKVLHHILKITGLIGHKLPNETPEAFIARRAIGMAIFNLYMKGVNNE